MSWEQEWAAIERDVGRFGTRIIRTTGHRHGAIGEMCRIRDRVQELLRRHRRQIPAKRREQLRRFCREIDAECRRLEESGAKAPTKKAPPSPPRTE